MSAEIRVELEKWQSEPELVVQLVNTSPADGRRLKDSHLYETKLEISGLATRPFLLESLPDSFRYDRRIAAYGINVGVEAASDSANTFRTTDSIVVETHRPEYWNSSLPVPDLRFERLAQEPIQPIESC